MRGLPSLLGLLSFRRLPSTEVEMSLRQVWFMQNDGNLTYTRNGCRAVITSRDGGWHIAIAHDRNSADSLTDADPPTTGPIPSLPEAKKEAVLQMGAYLQSGDDEVRAHP